MRRWFLSALALLALDAGTTALAPVTGLSLTADAHAQSVKWTGRIKRIKIKKRRVGEGFKVVSRVTDDGDATAAAAATLAVQVCTDAVCSEAVSAGQDEYVGVVRSPRYSHDGAVMPEGAYPVWTVLRDAGGTAQGTAQGWTVKAEGDELTAVPDGEVKDGPYISELTMTSDACGNGKARALVAGDGAEDVVTVEWIDATGTLFDKEDAEACADGSCITGSLKKGRTTYTQSDADLGEVGKALQASPETPVTVIVTALDEKGGVIGTAKTEATAKYGDILIDGVPLEVD